MEHKYTLEIMVALNLIAYLILAKLLANRRLEVRSLTTEAKRLTQRNEILDSDRVIMGRMLEDCEREKTRLKGELRQAVKELDDMREKYEQD